MAYERSPTHRSGSHPRIDRSWEPGCTVTPIRQALAIAGPGGGGEIDCGVGSELNSSRVTTNASLPSNLALPIEGVLPSPKTRFDAVEENAIAEGLGECRELDHVRLTGWSTPKCNRNGGLPSTA